MVVLPGRGYVRGYVVRTSKSQYWENTYTFQYDPDTWDAHAVFIDPNTGKPPKGLEADVGEKWFEMYLTTDFSGLDLL